MAFQGIPGSFSNMAATALYGDDFDPIHTTRFRDVFEAVSTGNAQYGVVPIENALAGSVLENSDLLREYNCWICREYYCPVHLCLLSKGSLSDIRLVFSHPKAIEQCSHFLETNPQIQAVVWSDTATAAQHVAAQDDRALAAFASEQASTIYSLPICERTVQNHQHNATRFISITANQIECPAATKCSAIVTLQHQPGSLHAFLGAVAALGLNLTKIESRPIIGKPFEYAFHIDLEKPADCSIDLDQTVMKLAKNALDFRLLGLYTTHSVTHF